MAQRAKKNLVVVRAGKASLHPTWLNQSWETRSFDMIVSYYSEEAYAAHVAQPGVNAVLVKGGKWDGLYKTLTDEAVDLSAYDYIWLPDDDIETNGLAIETMFAMAREHGLTVCQPSLTPQSYFSHFLLIQCAAFRLRYTNYIEIMVPASAVRFCCGPCRFSRTR